MTRARLLVGSAGILLLAYGSLRLLMQNSLDDLLWIGVWLAAAVAIHDGLLSPAVLAVGRALTVLPERARRYVQLTLVVGAAVTVVALPMVYRNATATPPESKTLLVRDYGTNLGLLLAVVATVGLLLYAVQVARAGSTRD
jgi:hypothetical protein